MPQTAGNEIPQPALPILEFSDPEKRYRLIAESSRDVIWVMDMRLKTVYMSPSVEHQLGYTAAEYLSLPVEARLPPESIATVQRIYGDILAELAASPGKPHPISRTFEMLHQHKNGRLAWGEVSISVLFDETGKAQGIHGITRDIEDRKRWERALKESEEKYRRLVELLPLGVFECDLEGRILFANDALFAICGYRRDEPHPELHIPNFMAPEDWPRIRANMARLLAGDIVGVGEYEAMHREGRRIPVEVHSAVFESEGRPLGFRGVVLDTSEKRRYEAEVRRANKLEAVGLLAGGIAHDFNNILAAVMGTINLSRLELENPERAAGLLEEAERAIARARGLTQQLLTFSHGSAPHKERFKPEALVRDAAAQESAGTSITVEISVTEPLPEIFVDKAQFSQMLRNLLLNAVEAMPKGGRIEIRLGGWSQAQNGDSSQDSYLRIEIEDEGPGVPAELRDRIFDPYFSTKPRASGLGLAVAYAVARDNGGDILVGAGAERGAIFSVLIPSARGQAGKRRAVEPRSKSEKLPRLLYVDNEEALRKLAADMAEYSGYRLSAASDAEEALRLWDSALDEGRPFDLLIVNHDLRGGTDGPGLLELIRERSPRAKALLVGDAVEEPGQEGWKGSGFSWNLKKPYGLADFTEAVEKSLRD